MQRVLVEKGLSPWQLPLMEALVRFMYAWEFEPEHAHSAETLLQVSLVPHLHPGAGWCMDCMCKVMPHAANVMLMCCVLVMWCAMVLHIRHQPRTRARSNAYHATWGGSVWIEQALEGATCS